MWISRPWRYHFFDCDTQFSITWRYGNCDNALRRALRIPIARFMKKHEKIWSKWKCFRQ